MAHESYYKVNTNDSLGKIVASLDSCAVYLATEGVPRDVVTYGRLLDTSGQEGNIK